MAYSDYGGYAYRNRQHVLERSDAVFSSDGLMPSTPGQWPGWTLPEGRSERCYHVILGDGPVFICMAKQSYSAVMYESEEVDQRQYTNHLEYWGDEPKAAYFNSDWYLDNEEVFRFDFEGHRIERGWVEDDNYYQYARLTQPDGVVWHGFAGYGVGAGLEDSDYHPFSTLDRVQAMWDFWDGR